MALDEQAPAGPETTRRRSRLMMWLAMVAIAATVAFAYAVSVRGAVLFLATSLLAFALVRAVSPAPGPYGISTRGRLFDTALLLVGAVVIAVIALSLPASELG